MRRTTATPEYLKDRMGSALLELMKEKPFEKITIEEMTARADVGRSTYFRYFKTKEEVLAYRLAALYSSSYTHDIRPVDTVSELMEIIRQFFSFWLSIRSSVDPIVAAGHADVLSMAYSQIIGNIRFPAGQEYVNRFVLSGLFGVHYGWVANGYRESPEELAGAIVHKVFRFFQSTFEGEMKP